MRESLETPVGKALWHIENHYASAPSLDDIATAAGVSRFHLSRAFVAATGYPVLRYVRGRRLNDAARALAAGAIDILSVALDSGYNSHEAFTRAFRDHFGVTPESVRAERRVDHLALVEPLRIDLPMTIKLAPPRFVAGDTLLIAGSNVRYNCAHKEAIPSQWQRFAPHIGNVVGQIGDVAYGIVHNTDEDGNMDYLCGVQVADFSHLPDGFTTLRIASTRYAVFEHRGHISSIAAIFASIWNEYFPNANEEPADAPLLERYDEHFDPATGNGGLEIWVAVRR